MPRAREVGATASRDPAGETRGPWGWRHRVSLAVLVAGGFLAFLVAALSRPGLPYRTDLIEHWSPDKPTHLGLGLRSGSAALERSPLVGRGWLHAIDISELIPTPGADLRSVDFLFDVRRGDSPLGERPGKARFLRAELRDTGRHRTLVAGDDLVVRTEELVEFRVSGSSGPLATAGTPSRWRLEVQTLDDVSLSLRCLIGPPTTDAASTNGGTMAITVPVAKSPAIRWAYPHGRVTTWSAAPGMSRAALVASLWDRGSAAWTFGWIGIAALAIGLGIACVPVGEMERAGRMAGWSMGLLFGGFGLVYLTVTPPFMGIDEVPHVFSYHGWRADETAVKAAWDLGYRTHFARLLSRPHQKFTPGDIGMPHWWCLDSPETMDTRPSARSAFAARVWSATRWWIQGRPAAIQIWRLRWISLLEASIGIGIAGWILAGGMPGESRAPSLGWWLLLVPSLPYFGMNVSNYPLLIGLWAVVASCIARMVNHGTVTATVTGALGLAYGLALHTSVNALPMAAMVGMVMAGWFLGRETSTPPTVPGDGMGAGGSRAIGWIWFGGGWVASRLVTTPDFDARMVAIFAAGIPAIGRLGMWGVWLAMLGIVGIVAGIEAAMAKRRGGRRGGTPPKRWIGMKVASMAVVLCLAANVWVEPPPTPSMHEAVPLWDFAPHQHELLPPAALPQLAEHNPPLRAYVMAVLRSFAGSWGPVRGDFLVSRLFWLENGYLDSLAPVWELGLLTTFFGLGLASLLWRISERPNRARCVRLVAVVEGTFATLVALAVAASATPATPTLHGRYLIGVYLAFLGVCFLGWKGLLVTFQERRPLLVALGLVLPPIVLHVGSLTVVFQRYFGG